MTFGPSSTTDDVLGGISLDGRLAVVTGAASGLGRETARALAGAGAAVILTARSAARAAGAAAELRDQQPGSAVEPAVLDLASLASVRRFAAMFLEDHDRLDLLINNAGVMATPLGRTEDGFELQLGTNHLGHFLLTALLAPALLTAAPSRVVNVSSAGHRRSGIDWGDPNYRSRPYDKWEAYGQSKTANILHAVELERRLGPGGVHAYAVHPGLVLTDLGRHLDRDDLLALRSRAPEGRLPAPKSVAAGAATQVWAATSPELEGRGGTYLQDCAISDDHAPWALDGADAGRLWDLSEHLVGQTFTW